MNGLPTLARLVMAIIAMLFVLIDLAMMLVGVFVGIGVHWSQVLALFLLIPVILMSFDYGKPTSAQVGKYSEPPPVEAQYKARKIEVIQVETPKMRQNFNPKPMPPTMPKR